MKLIKANPERRVEIPGVPGPVLRPVDIDRTQTGFEILRSLRIYRFDAGAVIDGHAEEDEVFVVVLGGSVEFTATGALPEEESSTHYLAAQGDLQNACSAAYLPPQAAYRLTATADAVVAYARATPPSGNPPESFQSTGLVDDGQVKSLLDEKTYAQRLRLRLFHIDASASEVSLAPTSQSEDDCEALIHIQLAAGKVDGPDSLSIEAWDTLAISPGEHATLHFARESYALALVVSAT